MTDVIQLPLPFQDSITGYVYTLTFPGGYTYVGSTTLEVKNRISNHISAIRKEPNKAAAGLIWASEKWGLHKVRCNDTNYKRWQFKSAVLTSKTVRVSNRKELYKHENDAINKVDPALSLNKIAAYFIENDFTFPVSCQEWVDLLYPEQSEQKVDAAA